MWLLHVGWLFFCSTPGQGVIIGLSFHLLFPTYWFTTASLLWLFFVHASSPQERMQHLWSYSTCSHPYSFQVPIATVDQYFQSFMYTTSKLWNSLPSSIFHPYWNISSFKHNVSRHLKQNRTKFWTSLILIISHVGTLRELLALSTHFLQYRNKVDYMWNICFRSDWGQNTAEWPV